MLWFTAPESWIVLGLHATGHARKVTFDDPAAIRYLTDDAPPDDTQPDGTADSAGSGEATLTFVLDRSGNGAGVIRHGTDVTARLDGAPCGLLRGHLPSCVAVADPVSAA